MSSFGHRSTRKMFIDLNQQKACMVRGWNRHCLQGEAGGNWACLVGEGEQVGETSQQPSSSYKARPLPTREGKAKPFEVHSGRKTMVLN